MKGNSDHTQSRQRGDDERCARCALPVGDDGTGEHVSFPSAMRQEENAVSSASDVDESKSDNDF